MPDYNVKFRWRVSMLFLVLLALFVSLGLWQLRRAHEKEALMEVRATRERDAPLRLSGAESNLNDLR